MEPKRMRYLIKGADVLPSWDAEALIGADIGIEGGRVAFVAPAGAGAGTGAGEGDRAGAGTGAGEGDRAGAGAGARASAGAGARADADAGAGAGAGARASAVIGAIAGADAVAGAGADAVAGMAPGSAPRGWAPDRVFDGAGRLAIPAFVNAHCHTAMALLRGYADDKALEDWLFNHIFPAEARLTEEDVYWGTTLGIAEMLRGGVACANDMYLMMDAAAGAFADAGFRAAVSFGPLRAGKRGAASVDAGRCREFFARWDGASDGRIRVNMEIHSVFIYEPDALREAARLACELGAPAHIHILETTAERANMLSQRGASSVRLAAGYGLLDRGAVAAHCVHVDDSDIEELAARGVGVAHCPASNLKLASGVAPVPSMLGAGVRVCLGTDGASSNNTLSVLKEMQLAAILHKGVGGQADAVTAAEAFRMATRAGALALGFPGCGAIAPGMKADIALVNLGSPRLTPLYSHLSALVYAARESDVESVFVDGEPLLEKGSPTTVDEEKAIFMARRCAEKYGAMPPAVRHG